MVAYKSEETDMTVAEDTKLVTNNENKLMENLVAILKSNCY